MITADPITFKLWHLAVGCGLSLSVGFVAGVLAALVEQKG